MILAHRLNGDELYINPDFIESVESKPETVLVLVDGRRLVVADPPHEIAERILRYRAEVLSVADDMRGSSPGTLVVLPTEEEGSRSPEGSD